MKRLAEALSRMINRLRSFLETMYGLSSYSEEAFKREISHIADSYDGGDDDADFGEDEETPDQAC